MSESGETNELDVLLARLRAAERDGQPEAMLTQIRKQITGAGDREAQARHAKRDAAQLVEKGPTLRPAQAVTRVQQFVPTPEIAALQEILRAAIAGSKFAEQVDTLMAAAEPYLILTTPRKRRHTAEETARIDAALRAGGQKAMWPAMAEVDALIERERERALSLGASRFGFVPDLPPEVPWPTHEGKKLFFLAQIDLENVPHWPGSPLPEDGRLMHDLLPLNTRVGLDVDRDQLSLVLPRFDDYALEQLVEGASPRGADSYARIGLAGEEVAGHLLGQLDTVSGTPTEQVNTLAGYARSADAVPGGDPAGPGDGWRNLLYLRTVGSMQWSDCGMLFFLMRDADLLKRDFTQVCLSGWSS